MGAGVGTGVGTGVGASVGAKVGAKVGLAVGGGLVGVGGFGNEQNEFVAEFRTNSMGVAGNCRNVTVPVIFEAVTEVNSYLFVRVPARLTNKKVSNSNLEDVTNGDAEFNRNGDMDRPTTMAGLRTRNGRINPASMRFWVRFQHQTCRSTRLTCFSFSLACNRTIGCRCCPKRPKTLISFNRSFKRRRMHCPVRTRFARGTFR